MMTLIEALKDIAHTANVDDTLIHKNLEDLSKEQFADEKLVSFIQELVDDLFPKIMIAILKDARGGNFDAVETKATLCSYTQDILNIGILTGQKMERE